MIKILVIDDDMDILLLMKAVLDKNGMMPVVSADASIADTLINELEPDIVLLDVNIPMYDGREICRQIKKERPALPVLLFSARKVNAKDIQQSGADGFLEKPFDITQMLELIQSKIHKVRHMRNEDDDYSSTAAL